MAFHLNDYEPKRPEFFATRPDTGRQKRKSRAQEDRVAKLGGGFRQAASGASRGASKKGDVRNVGRFLIECKRTDSSWIYLEPKVFTKIEKEAATLGKKPAIQIDVDGRRAGACTSWLLVPRDALNEHRGRITEEKTTKGAGLRLTEEELDGFEDVVSGDDLPEVVLEGKKTGRKKWVAIPEDLVRAILRLSV